MGEGGRGEGEGEGERGKGGSELLIFGYDWMND